MLASISDWCNFMLIHDYLESKKKLQGKCTCRLAEHMGEKILSTFCSRFYTSLFNRDGVKTDIFSNVIGYAAHQPLKEIGPLLPLVIVSHPFEILQLGLILFIPMPHDENFYRFVCRSVTKDNVFSSDVCYCTSFSI